MALSKRLLYENGLLLSDRFWRIALPQDMRLMIEINFRQKVAGSAQ